MALVLVRYTVVSPARKRPAVSTRSRFQSPDTNRSEATPKKKLSAVAATAPGPTGV